MLMGSIDFETLCRNTEGPQLTVQGCGVDCEQVEGGGVGRGERQEGRKRTLLKPERSRAGRQTGTDIQKYFINPFTPPGCKISRLKDAQTCLQTVNLSVL